MDTPWWFEGRLYVAAFGYRPGSRQAYRMPAPAIRRAASAATSAPIVGVTLKALYA